MDSAHNTQHGVSQQTGEYSFTASACPTCPLDEEPEACCHHSADMHNFYFSSLYAKVGNPQRAISKIYWHYQNGYVMPSLTSELNPPIFS